LDKQFNVKIVVVKEKLEIVKERGEPTKSGCLFFAAAGGEIRSNYFQYRAHFSKSQRFMGHLASLGGQIERDFG